MVHLFDARLQASWCLFYPKTPKSAILAILAISGRKVAILTEKVGILYPFGHPGRNGGLPLPYATLGADNSEMVDSDTLKHRKQWF